MPWHRNPIPQTTMVRTAHRKLAVMHGLNDGELYDLVNDPHEMTNRWHDRAYHDLKGELLQRLVDRMVWTVDPLPERVSKW